jgi:hypothetical protein
MNRFAPFFTKRLFLVSLVFDVPLSLLFVWRFTSLRHIALSVALFLKIFAAFLVIDYLIILLVFFIIFWVNLSKNS